MSHDDGGTDFVQHLRAVFLPDADLGIFDQTHAVAKRSTLRGDQLGELGRAYRAGSRPLIVELRVGRIAESATPACGSIGALGSKQTGDRFERLRRGPSAVQIGMIGRTAMTGA